MEDLGDVFAVFQMSQKFFELGDVVAFQVHVSLRVPGDFFDVHLGIGERCSHGRLGFEELGRWCEQCYLAVFGFYIVDINIGFQHRFQNRVAVLTFGRENREVIEHV